MDRRAALAAFDEQQRKNLGVSLADDRFERDGPVLRCVGATAGNWSGIDWADLDESNADEVIAAQIRYFTDLGRKFEWKYYSHDGPADLPERLRLAGFEPDVAEALMVAEIADVPADLPPPEGVRIVPVTDAEGVNLLVEVHEAVFGEDHSVVGQALLKRLDDAPEMVTPVLAMAGDLPVSAARIEFHEGTEFTSLWGGGTLEAWRGKGIYRATVGYRARLAAERGYRYLRVDALPSSEPILSRLGFVRLSTTIPYVFTPR